MNIALLQSALREMQRHFGDPRVLTAMAVVAGILGFSGPFGTFAYLGLAPRLAYWAVIVVSTYGVGFFIGTLSATPLRRRFAMPAPRVVLTGLLIGPPITLTVVLINVATFGPGGFQPVDWPTFLVECTLIAMGVTAISEIIAASIHRPDAAAASGDTPQPPPILERIPLHLRAPLVALAVADHYVEVATEKGKTLVLMRLGDAIGEVGATPGLQVHRSHWVSLAAIKRISRAGGKVTVELSNGAVVPVSRGFLPAARKAGLLV